MVLTVPNGGRRLSRDLSIASPTPYCRMPYFFAPSPLWTSEHEHQLMRIVMVYSHRARQREAMLLSSILHCVRRCTTRHYATVVRSSQFYMLCSMSAALSSCKSAVTFLLAGCGLQLDLWHVEAFTFTFLPDHTGPWTISTIPAVAFQTTLWCRLLSYDIV